MLRAWLVPLVVVVCAAPASSIAPVPEAGGSGPALVARLQPIDKLLDDARFLAGKFGKPDAAKELESHIAQSLGVDNLTETGIDRSKPSGLYVYPAAEIADSMAVAMLPVADAKAVLNFVGKFQVKAEKIEDEFYSLALPE